MGRSPHARRRSGNLAGLDRFVACTFVIAIGVIAGCGATAAPTASLPPYEVAASDPVPTVAGGDPASDGLISADEADQASAAVRADEVAAELFDRYGGRLTPWEPAELEGEPRGAVATIVLAEPTMMMPTVIRPEPGSEPDRVEDYVLVTEQLGEDTVTGFGVVVDLVTMSIVYLAPSVGPPSTTVPRTSAPDVPQSATSDEEPAATSAVLDVDPDDVPSIVVPSDAGEVEVRVGRHPDGGTGVCVIGAFGTRPGSVACFAPSADGRLFVPLRSDGQPLVFIDDRVVRVTIRSETEPERDLRLVEVPGVPGARITQGIADADPDVERMISFYDASGAELAMPSYRPPSR